MTKTRYEITEMKVRRKSSAISYDREDCEIVNDFGGWESLYENNYSEAKALAVKLWKNMNEFDRYNSAFMISEEEYDEENEIWVPGIKCHLCDFWMGSLKK
jgi:hypothetical protein